MKQLLLGLVIMGVGTLTGLQASSYGCCNPRPSWCCGSFEVGGQWIYLRPTSCDYECAIRDTRHAGTIIDTPVIVANLPSGKAHGVNPDYESGFRVSLGYIMDCSCYDVRVEYTYHHPCDRTKVFGSEDIGLWPTYMHPRYAANLTGNSSEGFETPIFSSQVGSEFVEAIACCKVKLDYDAVDLQFGSRSMKSCNLWLRTYAGLHFMHLDHKHEAHYRGADCVPFQIPAPALDPSGVGTFDTRVKWTKNTWGIGPLFGLDARYDVACGFGIGGHLGAAILAGETDGKFVEHDFRSFLSGTPATIDEDACVRHDHRNLLFPYLRASLGVNYLWCCGDCFKVLVEVGYEFNSYINSIGHFRFNDSRGTGMANCYSYNLDGIYVSVRATI